MFELAVDRKLEYDDLAVSNFREYLRIPSVHPNINYDACVNFLRKQASSLNLPVAVHYPKPKKPVVIITWEGTDPKLSSILLNSHMDVVPVNREAWKHDPFAAEVDEQGRIFGRGSQDMKCMAIQYLEAVRRLKDNGISVKRTVHLSFVPDEEIGGMNGMGAFVKTQEFDKLNVGFSLDEGIASPADDFVIFNGERCMWNITFHCPGQPGHGAQLLDNTAAEKVKILFKKIYDFRDREIEKLKLNPQLSLGDVTTVNVTMINGGVQFNVLPSELNISMDCRIPVTADLAKFEERLKHWCREAGEGVWMEKRHFDTIVPPTKLDKSNPYWMTFKATMSKLNYRIHPLICAGITDSRFIRKAGKPAIGFSPINNTPALLHDNDEYLGTDVFLKAIEIYCELLPALANVEDNS